MVITDDYLGFWPDIAGVDTSCLFRRDAGGGEGVNIVKCKL